MIHRGSTPLGSSQPWCQAELEAELLQQQQVAGAGAPLPPHVAQPIDVPHYGSWPSAPTQSYDEGDVYDEGAPLCRRHCGGCVVMAGVDSVCATDPTQPHDSTSGAHVSPVYYTRGTTWVHAPPSTEGEEYDEEGRLIRGGRGRGWRGRGSPPTAARGGRGRRGGGRNGGRGCATSAWP